jgi:hypothetical protein
VSASWFAGVCGFGARTGAADGQERTSGGRGGGGQPGGRWPGGGREQVSQIGRPRRRRIDRDGGDRERTGDWNQMAGGEPANSFVLRVSIPKVEPGTNRWFGAGWARGLTGLTNHEQA